MNKSGRYLGYFELKPDASLTFNTLLPAPPTPTITGISRNGETTTVSFGTVSGFRYAVRAASDLGSSGALGVWNLVGTVLGDGSPKSVDDVSTSSSRFFIVEVLP